MKETLLVLYSHEYDLINFLGTITPEKLEEFTQNYIKNTLKKASVKFEVMETEVIDDFVSIKVLYDAYTTNWNGTEKFYPRKGGNIGFYFYEVKSEEVNRNI